MRDSEFTRASYSSGCTGRASSPLAIFRLAFLRLHIETGGAFSTWLPAAPLELSRLGSETVRLSARPRGRKGAPLVFYVEAAARASSRTLFRQIVRKSSLLASYMQLTNYINGDLSSAKRAIVKRTDSLPHRRSATRHVVVISIRTSGSLFRFLSAESIDS